MLVVAAASELHNAGMFAALSAAALFYEVTTIVAFVILVVVAAFELLKAMLPSALSATAFCHESVPLRFWWWQQQLQLCLTGRGFTTGGRG